MIVAISHLRLSIKKNTKYEKKLKYKYSLPSSNAFDRQKIPVSWNSCVCSSKFTKWNSSKDFCKWYLAILFLALSPMNGWDMPMLSENKMMNWFLNHLIIPNEYKLFILFRSDCFRRVRIIFGNLNRREISIDHKNMLIAYCFEQERISSLVTLK